MKLDIGPSLFQCNLNIWDQLAPTIAPQNLAFRLLGRKEDFDSLVWSALWFGFVRSNRNNTCLSSYDHPWLFSAQGMPSFNFGNSFVSHVQRLDENPMAVELFGNLGGRIPAPNFCTIINSLSNQFLFTLSYSRTRYFLSFSHSSVHLQIPKSYPRTISHTCKSSWTISNSYSFYCKISLIELLDRKSVV